MFVCTPSGARLPFTHRQPRPAVPTAALETNYATQCYSLGTASERESLEEICAVKFAEVSPNPSLKVTPHYRCTDH